MDFYSFAIDTPLKPSSITVYSESVEDARTEAISIVRQELGMVSRVKETGAKAYAPDPIADMPIKRCSATSNDYQGYWAWFGVAA